jgi:hypothetical protein
VCGFRLELLYEPRSQICCFDDGFGNARSEKDSGSGGARELSDAESVAVLSDAESGVASSVEDPPMKPFAAVQGPRTLSSG